ncbi:hypothetical protein LTS18_009945 [Coniosporium uncinatum]|uniref:Uncharacterized protein n=1 Tax=Coniosporium uncinatum TaxID=93489 RepID=A0ACC3D0F7_9PEZI|nr:hypothetical protein LTS18_009945 [Coniosporium uncinatum]
MSRPSRSPSKSPKRRALGELTPNARTTSKSASAWRKQTPKTTDDISPLKRQQALTPKDIIAMRDSMTERSPASGHKRSFSEYERDLRRDRESGHVGRKVDKSTTQSPAHAAPETLAPVRT